MIDISDKMFDLSVSIHREARKAFLKEYSVCPAGITTLMILMITNPVERQLADMANVTNTNSLLSSWRHIRKLDWSD
jgi:hypothetical protein